MAAADSRLDLDRREHTPLSTAQEAPKAGLQGFDRPFETASRVEFQACDDQLKPTGEKGVLEQGKIVWGSSDLMRIAANSESEPVYLEARGLVLLNPRLLKQVEASIAGTSA